MQAGLPKHPTWHFSAFTVFVLSDRTRHLTQGDGGTRPPSVSEHLEVEGCAGPSWKP
jgi:hypothetical protein